MADAEVPKRAAVIDLQDHLNTLDHGQLADLLGDAKLVELVTTVTKSRRDLEDKQRGHIILDIIGGPETLLEDAKRRKRFLLTFSGSVRETLREHLDVDSIEKFNLSDERRQRLYGFFGLNAPEKRTGNLSPMARGLAVDYGLFAHQSKALLECLRFLESASPKVMLHMPTGSGKTRTAMHLVCRHLNRRQKGLVLWLVSGKELCEQAAGEFTRAWRSLGERPLSLVCGWEGRKAVDVESFRRNSPDGRACDPDKFTTPWPEDLDDGVIVGSLESVWGWIQNWEPGELARRSQNVSLVVFDEAHRSVAATYKAAVESMSASHTCGLLGLSATPGRSHYGAGEAENESLINLFGQQKVQLTIDGYHSPVEALIELGYLARLEKEQLQVAESGLSREQLRQLAKRLETSYDLPEDTLRHLGLSATRNLQIIERVEKLVLDERHKRVIVFAPSVESSNLIASVLKSRGIKCASITANTDRVIRDDCIREYKAEGAEPHILCNYGVLTTGFDAPKTSAVVIARPTLSIVLLNQMAGRGIRGPKVGGNATALLITVVDTSIPELVETINQFHAFDTSWTKPS